MSAGSQCDNCRAFVPVHQPGLLYLVQQQPPTDVIAAMFGTPSDPLTFCGMRCVAEYAYVVAVATAAPAGTEPVPRAGLGWPGCDEVAKGPDFMTDFIPPEGTKS